jgi:hypothetical protein
MAEQSPQTTQEIAQLKQEIEVLRRLIYQNNYSDLQVFTKKVQFKSNVGFYNTEPVAQQAAIAAPTAPGVTYSQAEAQSAVAKINALILVLKNIGITL